MAVTKRQINGIVIFAVLYIAATAIICVHTESTMIGEHFRLGVNLGNFNMFPFSKVAYNISPQQVRDQLYNAVKELTWYGGNTIRVWLHTDGSSNPYFSWYKDQTNPGLVNSLGDETLNDLKWLLSVCDQFGVKVLLTLWSHDILGVRRHNPNENRLRAIHMIKTEEGIDAYIKNALISLVTRLRDDKMPSGRSYHEALLAYEVFNEPEGTTWEARLYHNYQYYVQYGVYQWEDIDNFDKISSRKEDYRYGGGLKHPMGYQFTRGDDPSKAIYKGFYFLQGTPDPRPPQTCYSWSDFQRLQYTPQWKLDPHNWKMTSLPGGMYFNYLMYWDVFSHANDELEYLLPKVATCEVRTLDVTFWELQRFINRVAGAIKRTDGRALVTVGQHSTPYMSDVFKNQWKLIQEYVSRPANYYSCDVLKKAGGDHMGCLDFHAPHAYPSWGQQYLTDTYSPFYNNKWYFKVDVPVLLGEYWNLIGDGAALTGARLAELYDKGYAGGLGWAWFHLKDLGSGKKEMVPHETRYHHANAIKEARNILNGKGVKV